MTPRRALAALAAAAVVAVVLVLVTREASPLPQQVGFNNNAVDHGVADAEGAAAALAAVGAEVDRVQISWAKLEPRPGHYEFGPYDEIYAADLEVGVRPLFNLAFAPPWAAASTFCDAALPNCHMPPAPEHYGSYARALAALAERYPRAAGLEVWNEPNGPYFWVPAADPEAYATLLESAYAAVKEVDPAMPVAGGSPSSSPPGQPGLLVAPEFLRRVLAAGGGAAMDAVSVHIYPEPQDTTVITAESELEEIVDVLEEFGVSKPIWVTETGASTSGPGAATEAEQSTILLRLSELFGRSEEVEMMLVHTLFDPPYAPESVEPGFGIVDPDSGPSEAYCDLARLWGGDECP